MKTFKSFCIEDCGCKYYKKSKKQKQVEEAFLSNKRKSFAKHLAIGAMAGAIPLAMTLAGHTQKEKPTTIGNRVVSQVSPAPKPQAQPEAQHTDLSHGLIKHFEGFRTNAYSDKLTKSGVATIGWGMTKHPDGRPVKLGDTVTREEADLLDVNCNIIPAKYTNNFVAGQAQPTDHIFLIEDERKFTFAKLKYPTYFNIIVPIIE